MPVLVFTENFMLNLEGDFLSEILLISTKTIIFPKNIKLMLGVP